MSKLQNISNNISKIFEKCPKKRHAHKIDDSPALLVREFQMPHIGSNIHNKQWFIPIKIHHSSAKFGKTSNLVTLLWGKWNENGTITNNRSETHHEDIENTACARPLVSKIHYLCFVQISHASNVS